MKGLGISVGVLSFMLCACAFTEPHCENTNPVFRSEPYEADVYKIELARLLRNANAADFKYYLSGFLRPGTEELLIVNIHGADFCAMAAVHVDDWGKLADIRRTSGRGYRGAELQGLKINVKEDAGKVTFVYADVEAVVD